MNFSILLLLIIKTSANESEKNVRICRVGILTPPEGLLIHFCVPPTRFSQRSLSAAISKELFACLSMRTMQETQKMRRNPIKASAKKKKAY